jgi:hypothetical protein
MAPSESAFSINPRKEDTMRRNKPKRNVERVARRCSALKRRLVEFTCNRFGDDISSRFGSDRAPEMVIDDFIHTTRLTDGRHLLELFVDENDDLSSDEAALVMGWQDCFLGVFRVEKAGRHLHEATNLVDDLPYMLLATGTDPKLRSLLRAGAFIASRVVPVKDWWMLSGVQQTLGADHSLMAHGMAAHLAMNSPRLFFRNPRNLERAREQERGRHERFIKQFGDAWLIGAPVEIEEQWRQFMTPTAPQGKERDSSFEIEPLPPEIREAETVGMISPPEEGIIFLRDFDVFLAALENPKLARSGKTREVLLGYLEEGSCSPSIFPLAAQLRQEQLDAMMSELLEMQEFSWLRDGEALLRARNPEYLDTHQYPSTLPMNQALANGLQYLNLLKQAGDGDGDVSPELGHLSPA